MTGDRRSPAQPPGLGGGGRVARGTAPGADGPGAAVPPESSAEPDTKQPPVLDQVFDGDSLYSLRAAVAAHAAEAGLSPGRVSDAVAAVHELAANSVRHGAGHGRLRIWNREDDLHCLVTDDGAAPAKDGDGAPGADGMAVGSWRTSAGHGLWLVDQLADEVSLQAGPGGSRAAVTFALGPPGPSAPFQLAMRSHGGCTIIVVTGEFGPRAADHVIDVVDGAIATDGRSRLILDLSGLTLLDSSGVAALLAVRQRVDAHPLARLALAGLPGGFAQRLLSGPGAVFLPAGIGPARPCFGRPRRRPDARRAGGAAILRFHRAGDRRLRDFLADLLLAKP